MVIVSIAIIKRVSPASRISALIFNFPLLIVHPLIEDKLYNILKEIENTFWFTIGYLNYATCLLHNYSYVSSTIYRYTRGMPAAN